LSMHDTTAAIPCTCYESARSSRFSRSDSDSRRSTIEYPNTSRRSPLRSLPTPGR
jgi:hypothetical protein